MYQNPEEARSDLFLSAAVYLIGPAVLSIVLAIVPLQQVPGLGLVLALAQPVLFTALVPLLLIRYRKEVLARDYGLARWDGSAPTGLIAAAPIIVVGIAAAWLAGADLAGSVPLLELASPSLDGIVGLVSRVLLWLGLTFLAGYATVKARDAFRGDPVRLDEVVLRVGRIAGIAGGIALALLIVSLGSDFPTGDLVGYVLLPLGVTAGVYLALRREGGAATTTTPVVVTPAVLLALGPFGLTFNALALVTGIYFAALFAGIGLIVAIIVERTHRLTGGMALGLAIALLSGFGAGGIFAVR